MAEHRAPPGFRTLPHNVEVEQALIGAVMVNQQSVVRVSKYLKPEHFYEPIHGKIFRAVQQMNGRMIDHILLKPNFEQSEELIDLGGAEYLTKLAIAASSYMPDEADEFGRHILDLYTRRGLIALAEETANRAYDLSTTESVGDQAARLRQHLDQLALEAPERKSHPCDLPSLDWSRVANEKPPAERWLIDEWMPRGTSGIVTGPGASGKSFLELMRVICLASGTRFLAGDQYPGFAVEPTPCLAYFSEDSLERLWARVRRICAAYQIDPASLTGRLDIVSTVGTHRTLITSEHNSPITSPTEWMHETHDRARAMGSHYVSFDHAGRYLAINRNDPNQVFSAFGHLDQMASSMDGCIGLLAHPSKTDIRTKAKQGGSPIVAYVGGCAAMIDAPRWVEVLDTVKFPDGKHRVLINEKQNYSRKFAVKLVEGPHLVDRAVCEVDPDDPAGKIDNSRGRPSKADRTLVVLDDLFATHHRAIALDELVSECVRRGIVAEADIGSTGWRSRRSTIREHLARFEKQVDARDDDTFAMRPGA